MLARRRALTLTPGRMADGYLVQYEAAASARLPSQGCLVVDYDLPGMNGLQLLRSLRARRVDLPAILITTQPKRAVRLEAAAAGVPIVEKPLLSDALLESVQHALEARP